MEGMNYSETEKKEVSAMDTSDKDNSEPQPVPNNSSVAPGVHSQENTARTFCDDSADEEGVKKKKRKENVEKETTTKPATTIKTGSGRTLTGTKIPGPASKTGAAPLKSVSIQNTSKTSASIGKGATQSQNKSTSGQNKANQSSHQGKSGGKGAGAASQSKGDRKSPVPSPKPSQAKETEGEEDKSQETTAPKVPPLKIVIPGGAGSGARSETEGDGTGGVRGPGKGRNSASTLPYIIPCTNADTGPASDSSDGNSEDKRGSGDGKAQRVLRSHRTNDDKDASPQSGPISSTTITTQVTTVTQEEPTTTTSTTNTKTESIPSTSVDLHPRKRKIKASKEMRETQREPPPEPPHLPQTVTHCNPYQQFIQIQKQIEKRQKALFPVKPKPPKDFNNYLMNTCTYTLQGEGAEPPPPDVPSSLPPAMRDEYLEQEAERVLMRNYHQVEKEKLVLAVEQEILRVHGRAERAVANQSQPYSVCTILRDQEVYNLLAPEQEEKRNAQRSRCNGRQINSWLQEVDDKWEKIKEGMLKRQHIEAETLYASQIMDWEWKLKELALCDCKVKPKIDPSHVPHVNVANFDLPA